MLKFYTGNPDEARDYQEYTRGRAWDAPGNVETGTHVQHFQQSLDKPSDIMQMFSRLTNPHMRPTEDCTNGTLLTAYLDQHQVVWVLKGRHPPAHHLTVGLHGRLLHCELSPVGAGGYRINKITVIGTFVESKAETVKSWRKGS